VPARDDRSELREVVDRYASAVDRREPAECAALFTEDAILSGHDRSPDAPPRYERRGRAEITASLSKIARYEVTTHHVGQQLLSVDGDRATGETYCMAHHLSTVDGTRHDRVMSIRYLDTYARVDGRWLIAHRRLVVDWEDDRVLTCE
jgi:ketosteroid isomerase-like protein